MLKRLIEVALPLKEVSDEAAKDNRVRSGHIRTLHIWWARRPLVACRAVVFASLIPDPDDPSCPKSFQAYVMEVLKHKRYRPTGEEGDEKLKDTPRNRCLEFIKHLVKWENSNCSDIIDAARELISEAHKILHQDRNSYAPKTLDPFAGGGAIPLEALRLGCDSHATDLNPVAHLIELATLTYPQKFGQPNGRPVPSYISQLENRPSSNKSAKGGVTLFNEDRQLAKDAITDAFPDVNITTSDYLANPLAADIQFWGHWVLKRAKESLVSVYATSHKKESPLAFIWTRTALCPNPSCGATFPCLRQLWLCNKPRRKIALRMLLDQKRKQYRFEVAYDREIDFDPDQGTMQRGQASCPFCSTLATSDYLQAQGCAGRLGQQLLAVVCSDGRKAGKTYRPAENADIKRFSDASVLLEQKVLSFPHIIPDEPLKAWSGVFNAPLFGMSKWGDLFNDRQKLVLATLSDAIQLLRGEINQYHDPEYSRAVITNIAFAFDKCADFATTLCRWGNDDEGVTGTFGRQALPMVWDYAEANLLQDRTGGFEWAIGFVLDAVKAISEATKACAVPVQASATQLPFEDAVFNAVVTDPPYYDAVPYSDLSDFFYVWLKRNVGDMYDQFRSPLTPKSQEVVSHLGTNYPGKRKTATDYENGMRQAFAEMNRVIADTGIVVVMFAHKTTSAWETLIGGLVQSGLSVTASWPIHTEGRGRLRAHDSAALAGSISMVCRKRNPSSGIGLWDDVRKELKKVAKERLDFFWSQGIRGADFFISAIGPALSVFGKYEQVTRLDGEPVTVSQFLDEVRSLVTNYALTKILKTTHTGTIDPESRFYVVWKWSYIDAKVPADESFKLAQALGMDTELMWDRSGVLEKSGENVQAVPVAKRMKVKELGELNTDGSPASLIDVLHRMCVFREKNDSDGMSEFLARSGQANNPSLWLIAQAVSEILPDGEKEKQLMQGLLNQKEQLESAGRGRLF